MATDRKMVFKGIKLLAMTLPLLFIGPVIINSSFKNQDHFLFYPVLIVGFACCVTAMYLLFRGVTTIVNGFFNEK